jgi:hypothetical protein
VHQAPPLTHYSRPNNTKNHTHGPETIKRAQQKKVTNRSIDDNNETPSNQRRHHHCQNHTTTNVQQDVLRRLTSNWNVTSFVPANAAARSLETVASLDESDGRVAEISMRRYLII